MTGQAWPVSPLFSMGVLVRIPQNSYSVEYEGYQKILSRKLKWPSKVSGRCT
jgi:hypothetical protein